MTVMVISLLVLKNPKRNTLDTLIYFMSYIKMRVRTKDLRLNEIYDKFKFYDSL